MADYLAPAFINWPDEARIVGHIVAGYGELELEMVMCIAAVTGDYADAVRKIFGKRGEELRIKRAASFMAAPYEEVGLQAELEETIADMHWCRLLRNQYAHCHWYSVPEVEFAFTNLEAAAKSPEIEWPIYKTRYPVTAELLEQQETY